MISIKAALRFVEKNTGKLGVERIDLADAVGRVLAENVTADTDLPPFDRSMMDGYAVLATDIRDTPATLKIVGESAAGRGWHNKLKRGEAVRIMTGAPVPKGADAVQKVELTKESDGVVTIFEPAKKGQNIVRRGAEIKRGTTIFKTSEVVTENMIAALASFGYAKVKVARRPRIAILATGSEIVDVAKKPKRDQIRNSNSVMLDVLCRKFGAETCILNNVADDVGKLTQLIRSAVIQRPKADGQRPNVLIITGGVSVGKYDPTKTALTEIGAHIFFDKVCLKPGKPAVFAKLGKTLIFGLPGNPVSAAVTFQLFVRKAILKLQGATQTDLRRGHAVLAANAKAARDRDRYLPSQLATNEVGQLVATPLKSQGSSDLIGFVRADSLVFIPAGKNCRARDIVDVAFF